MRFAGADICDELPAAGVYRSTIAGARIRRSKQGNRMVQVEHVLDGVPAEHAQLADYFVLEGASPRGLAWARRRLVELYRASGVEPLAGEEIAPAGLIGARVEVDVTHDLWRGEWRLRVVAHRRIVEGTGAASAEAPF